MGKTVVNLLSEAQGLLRINQVPQTLQKYKPKHLGYLEYKAKKRQKTLKRSVGNGISRPKIALNLSL